ncbi:MAG: polyprenyl diphosphate synthase [Patescibacteria group bacterium]
MQIPQHVAIIMDGNRRWAKKRGLDVIVGHQKMANEGIERVVKAALDLKIKYLTLWAFSTENWDREPREIKALMDIFRNIFKHQAEKLAKEGVRVNTLGDLTKFDQDIQDNISLWQEKTKHNTNLTLNIALNYGGRDEILRAVEKITREVKAGKLAAEKLTTAQFSTYLDTADMPDPELIIRTSGEQRMSGFLLWQSNYSEFYFTDVLMPDFDQTELEKAIKELNSRKRRFGK